MREDRVAELLLAAWRDPSRLLDGLPEDPVPRDWREVRAIQDRELAGVGPVGGYKVGAAGSNAPISAAPLPLSGILAGGAMLTGWHQRWVEAEIAVKFARDLPVRAEPYEDHEVEAAIGSVHPVIEVLNSRFRDTTKIDPLSLAADLIMHGGLIVGEAMELPDLAGESVVVTVGGEEVSRGHGHPAGDMMRLLRYAADTFGLKAGQIVTTGSWNPVTVAPETASVVVRFQHALPVRVDFRVADK